MAAFHTEIACTDDRLRAAYRLRQAVFSGEQGYVRDEDDAVVGTLRIIPNPLPTQEERYYGLHVIEEGPLPGHGRTESVVRDMFLRSQEATPGAQVVYSGGKIGRVAVDQSCRGQGLGRRLLQGAEAWIVQAIRTLPVSPDMTNVGVQIQLSSQEPVRAFYESQGYAVLGDVYLEEGQPHIWCRKVLPVPI